MSKRTEVLKTYKLYIGGKFSRTESGRFFKSLDTKGNVMANLCRASRKDFRNSVVVARKAQASWEERSAYNKGQILYRIAENLEGRKSELQKVLSSEKGVSENKSMKIIEEGIDSLIYYAGWSDKYQALFGSVNPVSSSHFNFSILEPNGVVAAILEENSGFLEFMQLLSASIVGGNTLIVLAPENLSMTAMTIAEIIHHSDVPAGVVNILTGHSKELVSHMAGHMDVNTMLSWGADNDRRTEIEELAQVNLKRTVFWDQKHSIENGPYLIYDLQEVKTTWHPIEQIGGSTSAY